MPILLAKQRLHDDGALFAGVLCNLDAWLAQGGPDSINADLLVQAIQLQILQLSGRIEERGAAARDDALLECSLRGAERVVEPVLHLVDLHLRGATDLDDSDTAGELCQALLELILLVLGGGELDGVPDGLAALLDAGLVARGVQEHGVVLRDGHGLDAAELGELHVLELGVELVGEELRAREHRQVLHDGLAIVAKARRLHRTDLQAAAQLVDDEHGQGLAVDVLGDDKQRLADLGDLLEDRQNALDLGDLLRVEQDQRGLHLDLLLLRVGDKVRGDVAAIELHALDDLQLVDHSLAVRHRDGAVLADLLKGRGDHVADLFVAVRRDGGHAPNALGRVNHDRLCGEVLQDSLRGRVHAPLDIHGVHPGGHRLAALPEDGAREHRRRGSAVTGVVIGPARDRLHQLRADVDHGPRLQVNGLGNGHAVLGHLRGAPRLLDDDVPALRAHGDGHGVGQAVATLKHQGPGLAAMPDVLGRGEAAGGDCREGRGAAAEGPGERGGLDCAAHRGVHG
mmetsp:Transcript_14238/g.36806  ORF Transcript_14238/g.36806 Transcript_14238/m.36806 type:complete len:512 (-) Transcript_14238:54-1589(-)